MPSIANKVAECEMETDVRDREDQTDRRVKDAHRETDHRVKDVHRIMRHRLRPCPEMTCENILTA